MLNFLDPVSIAGLTVLRDDRDARTFYVLPDKPVVPLDPEGLPDFLFILYTKDLSDIPDTEESGGGYVQFRTVLSLPQDKQTAVLDGLRTLLTQEQAAGKKPFGNDITITEPVLAAPLWTSGSVDLATFAVSDTGLVRQATSKAPVDLTGDLGASFVATLGTDGAGVFEGAFKAYQDGTHQLPLVITYNLSYAGRITAKLTIDAKHSVVHERVWQRATPWRLLDTGFVRYVPLVLNTAFRVDMLPGLRAQYGPRIFPMIHPGAVGQAIQETISDSSVTVNIEEVSTGDATADAATRAALLKLATDLLTDSLMPSLTTGAASPAADDENQTSANTSLLQLDETATPGTATFHLELNDAMSIVRQAAPNAPLQVLIDDPKILSTCFHALRLADDFFSDMKITVSTSGVDFSASGIAKIHVYYRYGQSDDGDPAKPLIERHDDDLLTSATDELHFRFDTARTASGGHKEEYEYMAEVYWQKGGAPTVVPWTRTNRRTVIITPPLLGAIKVDGVLTAPAGSVDSARVDITYVAADRTSYQGALELTPAAPRGSWLQATGEIVTPEQDAKAPTYRYTITYRIGPVAIVMPERSSSQDTLEIPTPFTGTATFSLMAQGPWDRITSVAGTLTYADPAHNYALVRSFALSPGAPAADITVPIMAGGTRTASYVARVENADGTHDDVPQTSVTEGLNFVGGPITPPLSVALHTDLLDFTADVKAVKAVLKYTHADGTVTTAEPIFTAEAHATYSWVVPRRAGDGDDYDADVTFFGIDRSKDQTLHLAKQTSTSVELDRSMANS